MIALSALQSALNLLLNNFFTLFFSALTSFAVVWFLIPPIISLAHHYKILDIPDAGLKTHHRATAYLGGVAVFAGLLVAVLLWFPVDAIHCFLLLGCVFLLLLGLADDLLTLAPLPKFGGQLMIALSFIRVGIYLKEEFFSTTWAIPLSLFWLLSCMNALNLTDVMDGLAGTISVVAALGYFCFALLNGNVITAQLLLIFIGALIGFLVYNRPPARIYLGDAGSLFMGGFLGAVPLLISWSDYTPWGFFLAPLPLSVALLEGAGLIFIRFFKGISIYQGSKDHFCHYLGRNGWTPLGILKYVFCLSLMIIAIAVTAYLGILNFPLVIGLGSLIALLWIYLIWPEK